MGISISEYLGFTNLEVEEIIQWEKHQQFRLRHLPEDMSSDLQNKLRLGIPAVA